MSSKSSLLKSAKSEVTTRLNMGFPYTLRSYSQEGEDIVLRKIFDGQKNGFYVDVGAHHPFRYSNTQYFYEQGWHGINIDATPGSSVAFSRVRHRDINIEAVISKDLGTTSYYLFQDPALNTTSADRAREVQATKQSKLLKQTELQVERLDTVLDRSMKTDMAIDFMSIDVEGGELSVLQSNNWKKYSPTVLLIEALSELTMAEVLDSEIIQFLQRQGYQLFGRTLNTVYLRKK